MENKRLSDLRRSKNLSQIELGKEMGLSGGAIGMYECGKRTPNLTTALRIASYFNYPVENISFSNKSKETEEVVQ